MNFDDAITLGKSRSDCASKQLDELAELISPDVSGDIAEVGSYKCGATIILAATNPHRKIYAFDIFGGLPYGRTDKFDKFQSADFSEIQQAVSPFPNIILVRGRHEETIPAFSPRPLAFCFLDSDFYQSHRIALQHLWPMLSSKGSIVFHDWRFGGVQQAIRETIKQGEYSLRTALQACPQMGVITKI